MSVRGLAFRQTPVAGRRYRLAMPGSTLENRDTWVVHGKRRSSWLLIGLLAACAIGFALVALDVVAGGVLSRADPRVAHLSFLAVSRSGHTWLRRLTHLGDAWLLTVFVVLGVGWLVRRRRYLDAAVLATAGAIAGLATTGLKVAFRRSRPAFVDPNELPHSFSFPSGHASGAFAVYVLLALLLTAGLHARARMIAVNLGLVVAMLVAATRVLLPVHYLTDVIAGGCVGLAVVAVALLVREFIPVHR